MESDVVWPDPGFVDRFVKSGEGLQAPEMRAPRIGVEPLSVEWSILPNEGDRLPPSRSVAQESTHTPQQHVAQGAQKPSMASQ